MTTKFDIGEIVYLKAKVSSIEIFGEYTKYSVTVETTTGSFKETSLVKIKGD